MLAHIDAYHAVALFELCSLKDLRKLKKGPGTSIKKQFNNLKGSRDGSAKKYTNKSTEYEIKMIDKRHTLMHIMLLLCSSFVA